MGRRMEVRGDAEIREWLIEIREAHGLTQSAVALMVGISQPSYFAIEKGLSDPKPETAKRIGAALAFPWTRFYEEKGAD